MTEGGGEEGFGKIARADNLRKKKRNETGGGKMMEGGAKRREEENEDGDKNKQSGRESRRMKTVVDDIEGGRGEEINKERKKELEEGQI